MCSSILSVLNTVCTVCLYINVLSVEENAEGTCSDVMSHQLCHCNKAVVSQPLAGPHSLSWILAFSGMVMALGGARWNRCSGPVQMSPRAVAAFGKMPLNL